MCGIVGLVGKGEIAPQLVESIARLEYRGYDSCGLATLQTRRLVYHELERGHLRRAVERKDILVSQHLSSIGQSGTDILGLQTWMLLQDLALWDPLGQHAQNELDRNAGSPNDRLANHYFGIYVDTL